MGARVGDKDLNFHPVLLVDMNISRDTSWIKEIKKKSEWEDYKNIIVRNMSPLKAGPRTMWDPRQIVLISDICANILKALERWD